jgi:hypothetical protein
VEIRSTIRIARCFSRTSETARFFFEEFGLDNQRRM